MTKVRKQRKAKKFRYGVNRKRVNKKVIRIPKTQCEQIESAYEQNKSMIQNISEMGLSYDPNKSIKLPTVKVDGRTRTRNSITFTDKSEVVKQLETEAKECREKKFKLPQSRVDWLCKLIDKYGFNYKKMSMDLKLNPFQETWKQIRAKVKQFQKIQSQWEPYITSKMNTES